MDNIINIIESLNNLSGLFALLALISSIFVPYYFYLKGRRERHQAMQDELESLEENSYFQIPDNIRKYNSRISQLKKGLKIN